MNRLTFNAIHRNIIYLLHSEKRLRYWQYIYSWINDNTSLCRCYHNNYPCEQKVDEKRAVEILTLKRRTHSWKCTMSFNFNTIFIKIIRRNRSFTRASFRITRKSWRNVLSAVAPQPQKPRGV